MAVLYTYNRYNILKADYYFVRKKSYKNIVKKTKYKYKLQKAKDVEKLKKPKS